MSKLVISSLVVLGFASVQAAPWSSQNAPVQNQYYNQTPNMQPSTDPYANQSSNYNPNYNQGQNQTYYNSQYDSSGYNPNAAYQQQNYQQPSYQQPNYQQPYRQNANPNLNPMNQPYSNTMNQPQAYNDNSNTSRTQSMDPSSSDPSSQTQTATETKYVQDRGTTDADRRINDKIREKISGWFTDSYKFIVLNTANGNVIVTGYVLKADDLNKLQNAIRKIEGVRNVTINAQVKNQVNKPSDY